ncbi:hypothetical protein [Streptomyces sp. NPDC048142]|uniref:hypothetical protein n=1 Tax=Streptomyces sp. NPDC048142 TaxID=3365501 RepID=UPI003715016D
MVEQQLPGAFRGYRLEDLDAKDAAAIRAGRMALAEIRLEKHDAQGGWAVRADKLNFTVPPDVIGEYSHFEEIADEETRFWAADMWGATLEVPARTKARFGRLVTLCMVIETETEPYDLGPRHTGYIIVRDMGGERRRISAELISDEPEGS